MKFSDVIDRMMPVDSEWLNTFFEYRDETRERMRGEGTIRDILIDCAGSYDYDAPLSREMRSAIQAATAEELEWAEARFLSSFDELD